MRKRAVHHRRPLLGAVVGGAIVAVDFALLRLIGVDIRLGDHDVTLPVAVLFMLTFALLGYLNGKLAVAREQAQRDASTIREQLGALRSAQRRTLEAEKLASIGRLAAGVAHEVRNPLGVIRSSASLLEETLADGDDDNAKAARFIREESDRLDGFVRTLLDFSKPLQLHPSEVALTLLASRSAQLAAPRLDEAGTTLTLEAAEGCFRLDADLLVQALSTLLINGGQAAAGGRVVLRLALQGEQLVVEVADDGPGVSPALAERIFEPFVTTRAQGTGLGLPMAARVIEAHGGQLQLRQGAGLGEAGAGACFQFELSGEALAAREEAA